MKLMHASMTMDMSSIVHQVSFVQFDKDYECRKAVCVRSLESYTRGKNAAKMLSDAIVTIRNDRFVIPVKSEYRSHYGGVIHDMSSSGQTLFIEPDAVVQANNEIRRLKMQEQEEIEKIFIELSAKVQEVAHDLIHTCCDLI